MKRQVSFSEPSLRDPALREGSWRQQAPGRTRVFAAAKT